MVEGASGARAETIYASGLPPLRRLRQLVRPSQRSDAGWSVARGQVAQPAERGSVVATAGLDASQRLAPQ
jgi:hypothetical protein